MSKYLVLILILLVPGVFANVNFLKDLSIKDISMEDLRKKFNSEFFKNTKKIEVIEIEKRKLEIKYTTDLGLEKYVKKELRRYGSDYASVVVIDNNTGEILTAVDYTRKSRKYGKNLTFSSTNPAASVFKIVTAADLIENHNLTQDTNFSYNGKATTLYKYQLKNKQNKWTRKTNFKRAFARSNNVVFGKAAINNSTFTSLQDTARKFGFEQNSFQFLDLGKSTLFGNNTDFGMAELASGFNKKTMMSPVHGAVIASIVANDGKMVKPYIVKSITDIETSKKLWTPAFSSEQVISSKTSSELQELMEATVEKGTARSAFRSLRAKRYRHLTVGGKTGSITGGLPYGKRDWFVSYAKSKNSKDKGISVAVMIVNVKKWYIKSSYFAKNIIKYYYKNNRKIKNDD